MEPYRINGGMLSGHLQTYNNLEVQPFTLYQQKQYFQMLSLKGNEEKNYCPFFRNIAQQQQQQNPQTKPWQ